MQCTETGPVWRGDLFDFLPGSAFDIVDANEGDRAMHLEGIRVVDFSAVYAGPICARLMADAGAAVTKVELSFLMGPIHFLLIMMHR